MTPKNNFVFRFTHSASRQQCILFFCFILFFGTLSVLMGQDLNFDLLQYHFYNGYAFLHQRLNFDVGAGMIQTYINPFFDVLNYALISIQHPRITEFLLGIFAGISGFLLYQIAMLFFAGATHGEQRLYTFYALLIGLSGAGATLINTTTNDTKMGLMVLLSVYWLIKSAYTSNSFSYGYLILAAFCAGLVTGLKLTAGCYTLGLFITFFLLGRLDKKHLWQCGVFILFAAIGFFLANGYWMYLLYQQFHNPFFPYFNNIFHAPYAPFISFNIPPTYHTLPFYNYLFFFFFVAVNKNMAAETALRDAHLLALFLLGCAVLIKFYLTRLSNKKIFDEQGSAVSFSNTLFGSQYPAGTHNRARTPAINFMITFFIVSYILWVSSFAVYRYMLPIEWLTGILMVYLVTLLFTSRLYQYVFLTFLFLTLVASTYYPNWGNRNPYHQTYFTVSAPVIPSNATVLLGTVPLSYVIPFFPSTIHFVGMPFIDLGMFDVTPKQIPAHPILVDTLHRLAREIKSTPIYMLSFADEDRFLIRAQAALNYVGLHTSTHCQWVTTNIDGIQQRLKLCPVLF